jgi:hypothetical protein
MTILDIFARAPLWVWPLLAGLVFFGLRMTRDRDVGIAALVVMPVLLAGYGLQSLLSGFTTAGILGLIIGAAAGIAISVGLERRNPAIRTTSGRLQVKGEWTPLAIILTVFVLRFGNGVTEAMNPVLAAGDTVHGIVGLGIGLSAAILLTRMALRLRVAYGQRPAANVA